MLPNDALRSAQASAPSYFAHEFGLFAGFFPPRFGPSTETQPPKNSDPDSEQSSADLWEPTSIDEIRAANNISASSSSSSPYAISSSAESYWRELVDISKELRLYRLASDDALSSAVDACANVVPPTLRAGPFFPDDQVWSSMDSSSIDSVSSSARIVTRQRPAIIAATPHQNPVVKSVAAVSTPFAILQSTPPFSQLPSFTEPRAKSDINDENTKDDSAPTYRFKPFHLEKWMERVEELQTFHKVHGHCMVPHSYRPNPQLSRWCKRQRRQYKLMSTGKSSTMTPVRAALLESMGFVWDCHEAAWREKIQDLRAFRNENGHCMVPCNYKPNPQLGIWVKSQRQLFKLYQDGKPCSMTRERVDELMREGFVTEDAASESNEMKPINH